MIRLSSAVLMRTHRFLLEVHAAGDVNTLRRVVPDGLARLIACDRASLNEIEIGNVRKSIAPTPVPASWSRFGAIYAEHILDHPLWSRTNAPRVHRTIALSDRRYAGTWSQTVLC